MRRLPPLLVGLVLACSTPRRASSAPDDASGGAPVTENDHRETLVFTFENDSFTGSDDHYTNGFGLSWVSGRTSAAPEGSLQRRWIRLWSFLPFVDEERYATHATWSIGHEVFTPARISTPVPPEGDQPYAGVFFVDTGLYAKGRRSCHTWLVRLGLVGPTTHADDLQRAVHDVLDDEEPQGWDSQLPDEALFNLDYNLAYELVSLVRDGGLAWRLVPTGSTSLGTYLTGAGGGLYSEIGWNLHETIGLLSLRRGVDPVSAVSGGRSEGFSASLYAASGGFLVGHYLPLDGTVFERSRSVDSEPLVGFATVGLALRWGRFAIGGLATGFTDTFETQRGPAEFGSLSVSWSY